MHSLVDTAPGFAVYGNTRRVDFGASSWKYLDQEALAGLEPQARRIESDNEKYVINWAMT